MMNYLGRETFFAHFLFSGRAVQIAKDHAPEKSPGRQAFRTAVMESKPGRAATTLTIAMSNPCAKDLNAEVTPEAGPK